MDQKSLTIIYNEKIRRYFDENSSKWYFSIVDIVDLVTESSDARNYWKVLKNRLKKAQNQLVTECNQLKMGASDGKFYLTDVAEAKTILKIIELISEDKIPSFWRWFDTFGVQKGSNMLSLKRSFFDAKKYEKEAENGIENTYPQSSIENEEFTLMVDLFELKTFLVIKAFVAGINIEKLSISLTSKTIIIAGEREKVKNIPKENYQEKEIYWGNFSRTLDLPSEVEVDEVEAIEEHGLLTIKLKKIDRLYTKKVKIQFN